MPTELQVLYRAAVRPRYRRAKNPMKPSDDDMEFGPPRTDWEEAKRDVHRIAREHNGRLGIIQHTSRHPVNAGNWYLDWIVF